MDILKATHKGLQNLDCLPELYSELQEYFGDALNMENVVIAGGIGASLILDQPINDVDVFINRNDLPIPDGVSVEGYFQSRGFKIEYASNRSVFLDSSTLVNGVAIPKINVVHGIEFKSTQDLIDNFDFVHCMFAYDAQNGITMSDDTYRAIMLSELIYTGLYKKNSTPFSSMVRMVKYLQRGYTIYMGDILKLIMDIRSVELNSIHELQLIYQGIDPVDQTLLDRFVEVESLDPQNKVTMQFLTEFFDFADKEAREYHE